MNKENIYHRFFSVFVEIYFVIWIFFGAGTLLTVFSNDIRIILFMFLGAIISSIFPILYFIFTGESLWDLLNK